MEQPPEQPPQPQPQPQPWGGQPWTRPQPPREPAPPPAWGERPAPRQPWGYRPPPSGKAPRPPGGPPPWYRHPVGMLLIGAAVVILLAVVIPTFTADGTDPAPAPTLTTGAFGTPGTTAAPTTAGRPPTAAEQLGQAIQAELGEAGRVASVTAPTGGDQVTVTWDIRRAGSQGLTENNARFGVMRIMRAIQESQLTGAGSPPRVRLVGRYQPAGSTTPVTVVRLRFDPSTVARADFDDRNYLEAFELADAAVIQPSFRG